MHSMYTTDFSSPVFLYRQAEHLRNVSLIKIYCLAPDTIPLNLLTENVTTVK